MNQREEIRNFITSRLLFDDSSGLRDDVSFLESGIVDSTGMLELISFVEEKFNFKVADEEMVGDNFDSIERLDQFVSRKLAGQKMAHS